jgi:hypothetical protein
MAIYSQYQTGFNSVQYQFDQLLKTPNSRQTALGYIEHLRNLSAQLKEQFPGSYQPEKQTLDNDIQIVVKKLAAKYP